MLQECFRARAFLCRRAELVASSQAAVRTPAASQKYAHLGAGLIAPICSILFFPQLTHPIFLLFGLGCVDGLLHERVLRPACASVLLIFNFYPFRLLTVIEFSCQSAACRWAVSAPCVSCCGVDFPFTWASAPCPCQPTAADWIHILLYVRIDRR